MKTFTACLLLAAYVSAKTLPPMDAPQPEVVVDDVEEVPVKEETDEEWWARKTEEMTLFRLFWTGVYQGLYGMQGDDEGPTDQCFGSWIPEKMHELHDFRQEMRESYMVDMDHAAKAAYDVVDLMFLNDKYCHFRKALWDVKNFCHAEGNCVVADIFENMEKNAFNLITQVSSTVSIFKQTSWGQMDAKHKGYALN